jgi:hypothetical protein
MLRKRCDCGVPSRDLGVRPPGVEDALGDPAVALGRLAGPPDGDVEPCERGGLVPPLEDRDGGGTNDGAFPPTPVTEALLGGRGAAGRDGTERPELERWGVVSLLAAATGEGSPGGLASAAAKSFKGEVLLGFRDVRSDG